MNYFYNVFMNLLKHQNVGCMDFQSMDKIYERIIFIFHKIRIGLEQHEDEQIMTEF